MSKDLSPMQEQLLSQASGILQGVTDTVSKATNLAIEQMPDIAVQYVAFGRATESFMVLIGVIFLIVTWFLVDNVCLKNKYKIDAEARAFLGIFGGTVSFGAGIGFILANISQFFMVWFAPKVWLIKEIITLVK